MSTPPEYDDGGFGEIHQDHEANQQNDENVVNQNHEEQIAQVILTQSCFFGGEAVYQLRSLLRCYPPMNITDSTHGGYWSNV